MKPAPRKAKWWWRFAPAAFQRAVLGLDGPTAPSSSGPFAGGRISRLFLDWVMSILSADKEIQGDLTRLRARSRDLVRNSGYGKRFMQLLRANVVGPLGIRLQARVRSAEGRPFTTVNEAIEEAWREWGKAGVCTVDGKHSWRDVQGLLASTLGQDGEFIIRLVRGFDNPFRFAIQLIDVDLLDVTFERPAGDGVNQIKMGVELDKWGRPVAYHLWRHHPSEPGHVRNDRVPVPAAEIIHDFIPLRVGQTRGVPWFHSVLTNHRMLEGYQEAELVAARLAAAKSGHYTKTADAAESGEDAPTELPMEAAPGTVTELPVGYKFEGWDPQHPTQAFPFFVTSILRGISAGIGVSYHSLANDLSGVNYSSARVGELADRDEWRSLQQWMIEHVHARIYEEWLQMALLTGALRLTSIDHRNYTRVAWRPRGWAWVDPRNEIEAAEKELAIGLNSRTRQAAERGLDFEEICEELEEEQQLIKDHGLTLGPQVGQPANPDGTNKPPEKGDEQTDDDKADADGQRVLRVS